jgi:colicin import membrane protein
MIQPTLYRATFASFLIHLMFFIAALLFSRLSDIVTPKVYTVNIITPVIKKTVKTVKPPPAVRKKRKPPPPPVKKMQAPVRPKPVINETHKKERLKELKERKEEEEYRETQLKRIASEKRLERIRQKAATKDDQLGTISSQERNIIIDQYALRIQDTIIEAWIFPESEFKGLEATISITVLVNGTIRINRFENSSGNKLFDNSAIKAINRVGQVESPPFGKKIEIGVNFIPDVSQ